MSFLHIFIPHVVASIDFTACISFQNNDNFRANFFVIKVDMDLIFFWQASDVLFIYFWKGFALMHFVAVLSIQ